VKPDKDFIVLPRSLPAMAMPVIQVVEPGSSKDLRFVERIARSPDGDLSEIIHAKGDAQTTDLNGPAMCRPVFPSAMPTYQE
jgi:hypothetical protein